MSKEISWLQFKNKNKDQHDSFENLCRQLFIKRYNIDPEELKRYKNQKGIEVEPIEVDDEEELKKCSFQSKFTTTGRFPYYAFKKSIKNSEGYELDKIILYCNKSHGQKKGGKANGMKKLENVAEEIEVEIDIITDNQILDPIESKYFLLKQLYFSDSKEFGFIEHSTDIKKINFLRESNRYLKLPIKNNHEESIPKLNQDILYNRSEKLFLILGNPGSGKTYLMNELFMKYAGLNKKSNIEENVRETIRRNKAIPVLINFQEHNLNSQSLKSILNNLEEKFNLGNKSNNFIYLFDGLDEINSRLAEKVLNSLNKLKKQNRTKKIIISCRNGSPNKVRAETHFDNIFCYSINELTVEKHIDKYFKKEDENKQEQLVKFKNKNIELLKNINDIFLLKIFYESIEKLNIDSTILDLIEKKSNILLSSPSHKKNLSELNLPKPKQKAILELNKEISFALTEQKKTVFARKLLEKIILKNYFLINHKDINDIIDYISNLYLHQISNSKSINFYYTHKIYQDFFFIKKLFEKYENDINILRKLHVIPNKYLFNELFLKYSREYYKKNKNLSGLLELNLINTYLGNDKYFKPDDFAYQNSEKLIEALAVQDKEKLNIILENSYYNIKDKIIPSLTSLENNLKKWKRDKRYYENNIKEIWGRFQFLMKAIVILLNFNKNELAKEMQNVFNEAEKLLKEYSFFSNEIEFNSTYFYDYLYIKAEMEDGFSFDNLKDYSKRQQDRDSEIIFYDFYLKYNQEILINKIEDLEDNEFLILLKSISKIKNLHLLKTNPELKNEIKKKLNNNFSQENLETIFFKKMLELDPAFKGTELKERKETIEKKNTISQKIRELYDEYSKILYVLEDNYKIESKDITKSELKTYSFLFKKYIEQIKSETQLGDCVSSWKYIVSNNNPKKSYLQNETSYLWARMLFLANETNSYNYSRIRGLKKDLLNIDKNINQLKFYYTIKKLDKELFEKIINESEIDQIANIDLDKEEDFNDFSQKQFNLSFLFSNNYEKWKSNLFNGVEANILRHGWRKDIIICGLLVENLEIFWKNNWWSKEKLRKITKEVFSLTLETYYKTDGKVTYRGPNNVLDAIANYDIELAYDFKEKIRNNFGVRGYKYNIAITSIVKAKIDRYRSFSEIEKEIEKYKKIYVRKRVTSNFYEEKLKSYFYLIYNDYYKDKKEKIFKKIQQTINKAKENDTILKDLIKKNKYKKKYKELCKLYNQEEIFKFEIKKEKQKTNEKEFIEEVKNCTTHQAIIGKFRKLKNGNAPDIKDKKSWKILIDKHKKILENIKHFTSLLEELKFFHFYNWGHNSKYLYLGVAYALENPDTRDEMMEYILNKNTGYLGFYRMIKVYESLGDEKVCSNLFERYLRFCKFLIK